MDLVRGLLTLLIFARVVVAASLDVTVKDDKGAPVNDAVIYVAGSGAGGSSKKRAVIDQRDKQFVPY